MATAAIPSSVDGQFYACYDQTRLQLIGADNGQACPSGTTKTRWTGRQQQRPADDDAAAEATNIIAAC